MLFGCGNALSEIRCHEEFIDDPDYEESWAEGLVMYHNPNAEVPLNPECFDDISHVFYEKQDFLLSHDLEDIISVIDGRPEIANDVSCESDNLKQYLSSEFALLMNNEQFLQALPGHLNYSLGLASLKL